MMLLVKRIKVIRTFMIGGAVIVPGLPPFAESMGTSIFVIELWFALGMLSTLVLSGLLAARIGDKPVVVAGSGMLVLGALTYIAASGMIACVFAELLIGAGLGCIFGSDESLLHAALRSTKVRREYQRQWACTVLLQILFVSLCFYVGGLTYRIDPKIPFVIALSNYLVVFFASVGLPKVDVQRTSCGLRQLFAALRESKGICWIIAVYASFLAILRVSCWGYERFFIEADSPINHGTVMAIGALITAGLLTNANRIRESMSLPMLTALIGLASAASLLCMGTFVAPWCFILVFAQQIAGGFVQNTYASELHHHIGADSKALRAAIASFRQMMFLFCYIVVILAVHSVDDLNMAAILFRLGAFALVSSLLLVVCSYAIPELRKF